MRIILAAIACLLLASCGFQPAEVSVRVTEDALAGSSTATSIESSKTPTTTAKASSAPVAINTANAKASSSQSATPATGSSEPAATTTTTREMKIPASLSYNVAFASQAPLSNWDALHEEACEEASLIMAAHYFLKKPLDKNIMEEQIQKLIKWEGENGYGVDLSAAEALVVAEEYFGLNGKLVTDVTADRIKFELAQGNLIVIPAAGRLLGNPNFKQPGPIYHMLLVKGYDSRQFITNDPGTRKGNGYRYDYSVLANAVHDWDKQLAENGLTDAEMLLGGKVIISLHK